MGNKKIITALFILLICLASIGFYKFMPLSKKEAINIQTKSDEQKNVNKEYKEINILAVGDILVHETQLQAQYNSGTKQYDFSNNFKFVKPYIEKADIAIANLETSLGGNSKPYSGYPTFNTPDSIVDALKDAGFDVLTTANNHAMDSGSNGLIRTVEVMRNKGIDAIGTRAKKEEKGYVIKEANGIKVGISNYTFETAKVKGNKTLNSIVLPKDTEDLIDSFSYEDLKNDLVKMQERISNMKKDGAEAIVFYMHWGDEYERNPNSYQKSIAQALADFGADIIFASHPHVIEPMEYIKSKSSGKEVPVIYSMGNFISNQRYEILKNRYPEDGIIVNARLKKDLKSGSISVEEVTYLPTWVNKIEKDKKITYEIVPLFNVPEDKDKYDLTTEDEVWRAENSEKNTVSIIDSNSSRFAQASPSSEDSISVMNQKK